MTQPSAGTSRRVLLERVPAFALLPSSVRAELAALLVEERYPAGATVVTEGEAGDRLFLIAEGRVEVTASSHSGPVPLAMMGPGELFGELAVLTPERRRQATVTALTPLTLFSLAAEDLDRVLAAHPEARQCVRRRCRDAAHLQLPQAGQPVRLDRRRTPARSCGPAATDRGLPRRGDHPPGRAG